MALYLHAQYDLPASNPPPDDYIGPFPDMRAADLYIAVVGIGIAKLEDLDYVPPKEHTMTPGEFLDYQFGRWQ